MRYLLVIGWVALLHAQEDPLIDAKTGSLGPQWRFDRVIPVNSDLVAVWRPLPHTDLRWSDPDLGVPFMQLHGSEVQLQHRAPYDGDANNNLEKLGAVVFIAPADGVYRITGEMETFQFEGQGGLSLHLYVRRPTSTGMTALPLAEWPLPPHAVLPMDLGPIRLTAGEEFALMPRCHWRQSGLDFMLRNVVARSLP